MQLTNAHLLSVCLIFLLSACTGADGQVTGDKPVLRTEELLKTKPPIPVIAFETFCYRGQGRFSEVVRRAQLAKLKVAPAEVVAAGRPIEGNGRAWIAKMGRSKKTHKPFAVVLGASDRNSCSILSIGYDNKRILAAMEANYRLKHAYTDDLGLQTTQILVPGGTTGSANDVRQNGIIAITTSKSGDDDTITLNYTPPETAASVMRR